MLTTAVKIIHIATACILGVKMPRPMQHEAYAVLRSARLRQLRAPTGSGKTLLIQIIAMVEMLFEGRRTLIAVPQKNIGRAFGGFDGRTGRVWLPCRGWVAPAFAASVSACAGLALWHWCGLLPIPLLWLLWCQLATRPWVAVNKCDDASNSINDVEAFIRGGEGIMVCCQASLVRAWDRVGDAAGIKDLSLWIDEAHLASSAEVRGNSLGRVMRALVHADMSVRVGLATATFCRGDGSDIVHKDDAPDFERGTYECPFDRHFKENMASVERVEFDYVPYGLGKGWDDALVEWLKEKGRRTLIYIPHPGSILSSPDSGDTPGKIVDLERVRAAIERADPGADVVDLVTDRNNGGDNSEEMKAFEERVFAGDDADYVVALNLMKMGSDWPNLRSMADLTPSSSRPEAGQKFGRLAREPSRGVDKRVISYGSFFPTFGRHMGENMRRSCSERLASLISLLLLHYAASASLFRRPRGRRGGARVGNPALVWPELEQFLTALTSREGGAEHATCIAVARAMMDETGVPNEIRAGLEHIIRHLNRRPTDRTAAALREAGFDEVGYGELGAKMILTTGDRRGDGLFEKFRAVTRGMRCRSVEEWIPVAEKLVAENGGLLPNYTWLHDNGYGALHAAMCRAPKLFSHIEQEKLRHDPEEWVLVAEGLANENGGVLPSPARLKAADLGGLSAAMTRMPELFAHIEKDKREIRTPEEWVLVAERLADGNKGVLPSHAWFKDNGYFGLSDIISKRPELFAHIERTKKFRTPEEWIPVAEELARGNGGVLPGAKWIKDNGHSGLSRAMSRRPELFAHIEQGKKNRRPEKWLPIAEKLAEENGGVLLGPKWLANNGYGGLGTAMRNNPQIFAHIDRAEKKGCSPEEWVSVAEELARENRGMLPGYMQLCDTHSGLTGAMRKRPELFAHIEQVKRETRTHEEWVLVAEELAEENGGVLPGPTWLVSNGYGGLPSATNKRPELFAHIKQRRMQGKRRTAKEWVLVAEGLANENEGVLPNRAWLNDNGYGGLPFAMVRNPDLFAHIEQDKKRHTPEEWVTVAEDLARENRGLLPGAKWLVDNGHSGLPPIMKSRPELFAHIERTQKKSRSPEEWVSVAEKLSKENKGVLPGENWLKDNGYSGLGPAIRNRPELFAHVGRKKRRTPEEWVPVAEGLAEDNGGTLPGGGWLRNHGYSSLSRAMKIRPEIFSHIVK